MKIEDLNFSVRTYNCLKRSRVDTVEQLAGMSDNDLMAIRCFGIGCLKEVHRKLGKMEEAISLVVPGHDAEDPNIMELCFNNGKDQGRKEFKDELLSLLMELRVGTHWPEHDVLVRIIQMVDGM